MERSGHFWLDFVSCFLIPAYTLLFAGSVRWFGTNFSVLAVTGADHYRGFVYWGVLAGGYFYVMLSRLASVLPRRETRTLTRLLTACAALSLAYAVAIPYLPQNFPKYAALHVLLAALACVLLMLTLLVILLALHRQDPHRWVRLLRAWGLIALACAILFLIPRMVSTALEVFFTISTVLLTRKIRLNF